MPAFAPERLLLIEVAAEGAALTALSGPALHATVRNAVLEQFGDFGAGCVLNSLQVRNFSAASRTFVLRLPRAHVDMLRAALAHVAYVQCGQTRHPATMRVLRAAGSARTAQRMAREEDDAGGQGVPAGDAPEGAAPAGLTASSSAPLPGALKHEGAVSLSDTGAAASTRKRRRRGHGDGS